MGSILGGLGIGGVLDGVGAIAGMFGGGGHADFGSSGDLSAGKSQLNNLSGLAGQYGSQAQNAFNSYGSDNNAYRNASGNEAALLSANPYTDAFSTAQLAASGAGSSAAYSRARANLQATAAGMGLGGGAGSMLAGGQAGIDASAAGQISGQQNQLALQAIAQHRQNLGQLTNLYGGMSGTDYNRGMGALGGQTGIDSGLASSYLGLGQNELNMEQNLDAENRQATSSAFGGLGSILGSAAGYGRMGGYGGNGGKVDGMSTQDIKF